MHNIFEEQPLPQFNVAQMQRANWQTQLGRSVFALGQTNFIVKPCEGVDKAVGLSVIVDGKGGIVAVSSSLINRFLEPYGTTMANISSQWLGFLLQAHHAELLPAGVQIEAVCEAPAEYTVCYSAQQYGQERELFQFGIGPAQFTEEEFIAAMGALCVGKIPSPVEQVPIAVPLVATSLEVPADELAALEVGDILLVG